MTVLANAPVRRSSVLGWTAIAVALVVIGAAVAVISGIAQRPAQGLLDAEAAGPEGARALVHILRDQGVEVTVARDIATATAATGMGTTLVLGETTVLSDETLETLTDAAGDVVLIDPRARDLRLLLDGAAPAGVGDGPAAPDCELAEAQRAGTIDPGPVFSDAAGVTGCYPSGDGFGLLVLDTGAGRIAAVDGTVTFTNEFLAADGNAALALGLMGRHAEVVWYVPGLFDGDRDDAATLGDLTPDWVSPAIALAVLAGLAAAIWRGRRFGPLVAETLPVTVRAGETTAGRARLYARAGDAGHAADQLRIAALGRLSRRLSLGPAAAARDISDAVAAHLGTDPGAMADLLIHRVPASDRDLVDLADRLREVEAAVSPAFRPERTQL